MNTFSQSKKTFHFLIIGASLALTSAFAFSLPKANANSGSNSGYGSGSGTTVMNSDGSSGTSTPTQNQSSGVYIPPPREVGGGASDSARRTSDMQMLAGAASGAMAGHFAAKCSSKRYWNCIRAAISAAQAGMFFSGSDINSEVANELSTQVGGARTASLATDSNTGASTMADAAKVMADTTKIMREMNAKGYSVSPDGKHVTTPDGKKVLASAFQSAAAMAAAGFSEGDIEDAQTTMLEATAAAKDKMRALQMTPAGGGGGGSRPLANDDGSGGSGGTYRYAAGFGVDKKSKNGNPNLAGMSKNFGSDRIGIAGDNIFEMVTRRYKARDAADNFIKGE